MVNNADKYISFDEACKRLDVSKVTARQWCKDGLLSCFYINRKKMILLDSVTAMSENAISIDEVHRNIETYIAERNNLLLQLKEEVDILNEELQQRRWGNNHIEYFAEMFSLMMQTLYEKEDAEQNQKLVRYFLQGDNYKDIALLTGKTVPQVMSCIRRFGRNTLRTRTYVSLYEEVKGLKDKMKGNDINDELKKLTEEKERLENEVRILKEMMSNEKKLDNHKVDGANKAVKNIYVADCRFSRRLLNVLNANHFHTLGDIIEHTRDSLLSLHNMGRKSMSELEDYLTGLGLEFKK